MKKRKQQKKENHPSPQKTSDAEITHYQLTGAQPVPEQWQPWPTFFPCPILLMCMTSYVMGCPFGQLGSAALSVPLPSFWGTLSLLAGRAAGEAEKALKLCKHCSAIAKTPLCYQHCFRHKPKT